MEILEEKPISCAEVKEELSNKKSDDNFRISKTKEYLDMFTHISKREADELYKKLEEAGIPRMKEALIIKLIDLLPEDEEGVKILVESYNVSISSQNIKKIVDVIKEFKEKHNIKAKT
jgi:DNA-directed RNA polymerase subunit F